MIIVRDNQEYTHRNVALKYSGSGFTNLIASTFVNPLLATYTEIPTFTLKIDQETDSLLVYLNKTITDASGIGSIQLDISGINGILSEDVSIDPIFNVNYQMAVYIYK